MQKQVITWGDASWYNGKNLEFEIQRPAAFDSFYALTILQLTFISPAVATALNWGRCNLTDLHSGWIEYLSPWGFLAASKLKTLVPTHLIWCMRSPESVKS